MDKLLAQLGRSPHQLRSQCCCLISACMRTLALPWSDLLHVFHAVFDALRYDYSNCGNRF